jgi:hypothetical protein
MLKESQVFGVGFGLFLDHEDLTAHKSFVLCFAELGLFGYFFWLALIVYSVTDLNSVLRSPPDGGPSAEIVQCAVVIRIALITFLVTAGFLSRTYVGTFYLLIGMAVVARRLAQEANGTPQIATSRRWLLTGALEAASIVAIYAVVRLRSMV